MTLARGNAFALILLAVVYYAVTRLVAYGREVQRRGKEYYRQADSNRLLVERELGLLRPIAEGPGRTENLSLGATTGQIKALTRLGGAARNDEIKPGSIVGLMDRVLAVYCWLVWLGAAACLLQIGWLAWPFAAAIVMHVLGPV